MTKIQIRKVNGVPMGRPKNPWEKPKFTGGTYEYDTKWQEFEQSVTEHEAPGFEEGETEGELQWRAKIFGDKEWELMPIDHEPINAMGVINQLIWIVPTPEKVEVKEVDNWIRVEDRIPNVAGDCEFSDPVLIGHDIDKWVTRGVYLHGNWYNDFDTECPCYPTHWQPLPSPPTH